MRKHFGWMTLLATTFASLTVPAADFWVATNGSDSHPGTKTKPFATPAQAMKAIRKLVAAGQTGDIRVNFQGGFYPLSEPLIFTPADSGSEQQTITYAAVSGEEVVMSGGRRIENWQPAPDSAWTADLDEVKRGRWFFRQLIINDRRAIRARWPNEDGVLHIASVSNGVKTFTFDRALPGEQLGRQDAELVVYENWSVTRGLITASDDARLSTATAMGWIGHGPMTTASPGKPAFIENLRAGLDQPGEWHLDRKNGRLTCLAETGGAWPKATVIAPVLNQLIRITGTKDRPVRNIHFEGLRFEHTDFPIPPMGYSEIQAAHYGPSTKELTHVQPAAIECSYAEGIRFERCRLAHLNNSGLGFGAGCRENAVIGCLVEDIGGNGIMIGWRGAGRLQRGAEGSLDADWAEPTDAPRGNQVANCVIRQCGADSRGGVGIFVAFSADTRIAHNVIHEMPYTGMSIGYRWNTTPTSQMRCLVEFNHIHDVMRKLADGGGIYTLGFQPGTVFRGNLIHDVHRSAYAHGGAPNNGFFIDEGSKGFLFESNVVHGTSGKSVRFNQNQRDWHIWEGNAFDGDATSAIIAGAAQRAGLQPDYRNRSLLRNQPRDP